MKNFYRGPEVLNMKKVVTISVIFIVILLGIIFGIARKISTPENTPTVQENATSTVFYSNDNSVCIELSNLLNLKNYDSNLGYLLELRSDRNLNLFLSTQTALSNKALLEIVEADKPAFLSNFESCSNVSEIKELANENHIAYTYSFHYLDKSLNKAFYLQILWLQIDNQYYIFDIEFPLNDLSFYTDIPNSILSSFQTIC